ncbi:MAG: CRISPR-associated endonuclease Cas2 [Candidatus Vogelbacteria bacterium]|nr:CRISPR-associated endonuclease Cas2 [Candidatus Vogelbacteria bacterium]
MHSPTKQKVLLLLAAGVVLGLSKSFHNQRRILKMLPKAWKEIDRQYLYRVLREFYQDRLVSYRERDDGTVDIVLTEEGKKRALSFQIDKIEIKRPAKWNGKWSLVTYDIPEKKKPAREALREKLKELGFYEWQKSVFIYPFPCRDEIDFLIEFFEIRSHVRYAELSHPTNEAELKLHFEL